MSSATEIKASDVQKLRQTTGAGLMDCKKALVDSAGDMEKAIKLLRERGIAKSSKRADRATGEGIVVSWVSDKKKEGILFELNCETDFVARNDQFVSLAGSLLERLQKDPSIASVDQFPRDVINETSAKTGEKIVARRFERVSVRNGLVAVYIHAGSKLGVMIPLETDKEAGQSRALTELGKELALQIAGASPSYVDRQAVPSDIIEREKEITKKQMEGQKKPPEILEKIAVGKLNQFYSLHCLLDQPHVRDSSGKTLVKDLIAQVEKKEGLKISIPRFVRFRVGAD